MLPPEPEVQKRSVLRAWFNEGFWAVVDQGLFGGANFFLSVVLARLLSPDEFGAFSICSSVFLLMAAVHTSIVTEPMMVFGAADLSRRLRSYLGFLLYLHLIVTSALSLGVWLVASALPSAHERLATALGGLALAAPFMLLAWLARRAFYADFHARAAACSSAIFFTISAGVLFALRAGDSLSARSALIATGAAGMAASAPMFIILRPSLLVKPGASERRTLLRRHWSFGSWNTLGASIYLLSTQLPYFAATAFLGLESVAAIAAAVNLYRPLYLLMQSSTFLTLPAVSRVANQRTASDLKATAGKLILTFAAGAALYGVAISLSAEFLMSWIYQGRYDGYVGLVSLLAVSSTASAVVQGVSLVLKARGRVRPLASIWGVSSVITVVSIIPAMTWWGLNGAISATALGYVVAAVSAWRALAKET